MFSTDVTDFSGTPVTIPFTVVKAESEALEAGVCYEEFRGDLAVDDYHVSSILVGKLWLLNSRLFPGPCQQNDNF